MVRDVVCMGNVVAAFFVIVLGKGKVKRYDVMNKNVTGNIDVSKVTLDVLDSYIEVDFLFNDKNIVHLVLYFDYYYGDVYINLET